MLALSVPPIAAWMAVTHAQTGYWTGTDRARERDLPESVRHWAELTGLDDHVRLTAKTLWIDFLSPDVPAAVNVVTLPYRPSPVEWGLFALAVAAAATGVAAGRRAGGVAAVAGADRGRGGGACSSRSTIAVWTVGNNDPIHTRFLFPVYPLLCLLAFHAYEARARLVARVVDARAVDRALRGRGRGAGPPQLARGGAPGQVPVVRPDSEHVRRGATARRERLGGSAKRAGGWRAVSRHPAP